MNRFNSQGIILSRTNYGEADRIITFLTPDHGKVRALAKGVRKSKSKLAGGIELFSVSELSFIIGRGEINTLISSRLVKHFGDIVKDLDRTNLGYELIRMLNKATEDQPETAYFNLLHDGFVALNDNTIDTELIMAWFMAQLLSLAGHQPNLDTEKDGLKLAAGRTYDFDYETMTFTNGESFDSNQIKFLRLVFSPNQPATLQKINQANLLSNQCLPLIRSVLQLNTRL